ncbi:hypothetical protein DCF79_08030 [Edwardsiella tarda]|uniref:LPD38 domain-containing protein n=1 Tax=Edwardsiella tarda TaxID=636 RepID=UPI000D5189CD|nr:LPD38 domain-containing protein [Edwardsiella tarda]UCQ19348.1 hypothetical protein DCF79_08030 [Edwardsiella tarda]
MANSPQDLRPEQQRYAVERQSLNIQQPDEGLARYWDSYDPQKYAGLSDESAENSGNIFSDTGHLLWSGLTSTAASLREATGKVPLVGGAIVSGLDAIDQYVLGHEDSESFLRADQQNSLSQLSPAMQQAREKSFWESGKGLGEAWVDPRSYFAGVVESAPGMAVTMGPALRLAKLAYSAKVAQGVAAKEAAASAARVASLTGRITEGVLAGGASSNEVKAAIYALPDEILQDSEAAQNLLASGMSVDEVRKALAEDASTKAFILSAVATGMFGGQGDTVIAKIMTGQLKQGVMRRFAKGAVAEGLFEEVPQSALSQMAENYALQSADPQRPLSDEVMNQALGGLAIGGVMGGSLAAGSRTGKWQAQHDTQQAKNDQLATDDAAGPTEAQAQEAYSRYQTQFASLDRDTLLQHYAEADLSEAPDAAEKKRAAHERLQALEHDEEVKKAAKALRGLPRTDLLAQYHTLNEKATRTATEQLQWEAARWLLRQRMAAATSRTSTSAASGDGAEQENAAREDLRTWQAAPLSDQHIRGVPESMNEARWLGAPPDPAVVQASWPEEKTVDLPSQPAYQRRDPRIQGFAEDSPLQQVLSQPGAPSAIELVQAQMQRGEQGLTPDEWRTQLQAEESRQQRAPRLPAPGDISPGRGFPLPGPVAQVDDRPAGSEPEFSAGVRTVLRPGEAEPPGSAQMAAQSSKNPASTPEQRAVVMPTSMASQASGLPPRVAPPENRASRVERDVPASSESPPEPRQKTFYSHQPDRPDGSLSFERVSQIVHDFEQEYKGNIPIEIRVYRRQEDAYGPQATRENVGRIAGAFHGGAGRRAVSRYPDASNALRTAAGTLHGGRGQVSGDPRTDNVTRPSFVLVNAASIRDEADARRTLRHEILGHFGLNTFTPADKRQILDAIMAAQGEKELSTLWNEVRRGYSHKSQSIQAEEVFALAAEQERKERGARSGRRIIPARVLHAVQSGLRRAGLVTGGMRLGELYDAVDAISDGIRHGHRQQQIFPANDQVQFKREEADVADGRTLPHPAQRPPWPDDFPDVVLHARLGGATGHPDYKAAKNGDELAARRLVADVLSKDAIDKIRRIIGKREVLLTAVHAEEASGRNKIPQAMADMLGHILHQHVDDNIVQAVRVGRSGMDGFARLANQPSFAGEVRRDAHYFILDDTLTQGGTLAGLRGYIEAQGGQVIGASALTGKMYSAKMALSASTLSRLRVHFGGSNLEAWWKQQFGYGFDGLTESEAQYLLRAGDADTIRDRVLAARQTGDTSAQSGRAEGDGPLPPDVTNRSAQNASQHGGVSVLGQGNRLTETGHSPEVASGNNPIPQINAVVRGVMRKLNAPSLHVRVVQTQKEAEPLAGEPLEQYGKVHAFYRPQSREIVLIADNLPTPRMVREKLRHEVIHHALEQVITPEEYQRIIDRVMETRASRDAVIQQIWRRIDAAYGQEPVAVQAGEFLAHMAEKQMPGRFSALWDRVVSLIKTLLNRIGLLPTVDAENRIYLRDTLRTLGQRLRQGYRPTGSATSADVPNAKASTPQDPLKPLAEEADHYRRALAQAINTRRTSDITVRLGRTPPVLRLLGAADLEVVITRDVIRKATNGVKHVVPMAVIEQLPELMHDPLAVYRSATQPDAVVMHLALQDRNGDPVLCAVHFNAALNRIEVNKIASVYGTKGGMAKINKMEREGLALYRREKEAPGNPLHSGLQLPKGEHSYQEPSAREQPDRSDTHPSPEPTIRSADDVRNSQSRYSREGSALEQTIRRKMGLEPEHGWGDKAHDFYRDWKAQRPSARRAWLRDLGRRLNTATFDGLAPIKYAEASQGNVEAARSAYIAARLAAGANTVMAATLEHGLPVYNPQSGVIERKAGSGKSDALLGILDALGKHREDFFIWIAGHRSERLMQEGREKLFSADEIRHMKARDRGKETLFAQQKVKYDALVKSLLDLQQATGLIDPERRAVWEDAWYLPYFRQTEDGGVLGPWSTRGIANQRSTVRRLKGGEQAINDPVENLVNYVARAIDASMKNEAMRRMVVNLADSGVIAVIEKPNRIDYQRLGKRQGVAKVYLEGEEQLVEVSDPALFRAITMMDMERSNALFMRAARQAKRILTIGTTSMPDFIIRNFMRDSLHSWTINPDGVRAVTSAWAGLKKAYRQDDTLIEMMFAGATFGGGYANAYDPASTAQSLRAILRRKGYSDSQARQFESTILRDGQDVLRRLGGVWSRYRHLSEAAENANRVATYQAALKAGKGRAQAAYEARDLMDFSMQGAAKSMIVLTDMLPFFNARMQGLGKLARAVKANPQAVLKRGGLIVAASVALLAANWDDDRYEALPDWDKDIYWHFFIGDQHFRLPKPFEIGLMFATLPERMIRAIGGKESGKKFAKLVAHNFMEQLAFNPIPQIALPLAENLVNYDFFSGNPIEGMADANLLSGARYDQRTSLLARQIGEQLGWSPKKIDHLITGYTGTLGAYVLGAMDIVLRGMGEYGERPALRVDELPVIKSFLRGSAAPKSTQYSDDFYRMMQQANQVYGTVQRWKRERRLQDSRALQREQRHILASRPQLNRTQQQVRQLNSQIQMIQLHTRLSAEEKRQRIDKLLARRNHIVQQAVKRMNRWFE